MIHGKIVEPTRRRFLLVMTAGGVLDFDQDRQSQALANFGSRARTTIEVLLGQPNYRGQIRSSDVASLMGAEQLTREALMLKLVPLAKSFAHPPLSNYFVGAVLSSSRGNMYLGANIEVPGNMLGLAVHAEQAALANAYMADEIALDAIAVSAAPCGHCRQFLSEASLELSMRVLLANGLEKKLSDLLPQAFGPKDLGFTQGLFPIKRAPLSLFTASSDPLVIEALNAACAAYSPYSRSPSGVALLTSTDRIFSGAYIENAAFNPSLPPLETALAGYFAAGRHAGTIKRAVLVEGQKSSISQEPTTRSVLAAIAPLVNLARFPLKQF